VRPGLPPDDGPPAFALSGSARVTYVEDREYRGQVLQVNSIGRQPGAGGWHDARDSIR